MPDPKWCPQWTGVKVDAVADWSCLVSIGFTGAYHLSIYTIRHMYVCVCMMYIDSIDIGYQKSLIDMCNCKPDFASDDSKDVNPSRFYASDLLGPWGTSAGALFIISPEISMPTFAAENCSIFQSLMFQKQQYTKYTSLVLFEFMSFDENETVTLGWAWSTKFTKWQIKSSFEDIWLLSAMRTARSRASICQSAARKCDECHRHRWYTVMLWLFSSNIICILYIYRHKCTRQNVESTLALAGPLKRNHPSTSSWGDSVPVSSMSRSLCASSLSWQLLQLTLQPSQWPEQALGIVHIHIDCLPKEVAVTICHRSKKHMVIVIVI